MSSGCPWPQGPSLLPYVLLRAEPCTSHRPCWENLACDRISGAHSTARVFLSARERLRGSDVYHAARSSANLECPGSPHFQDPHGPSPGPGWKSQGWHSRDTGPGACPQGCRPWRSPRVGGSPVEDTGLPATADRKRGGASRVGRPAPTASLMCALRCFVAFENRRLLLKFGKICSYRRGEM